MKNSSVAFEELGPVLGTPSHLLEHAIAIAVLNHRGQKDKAGNSYILHVLRVMLAMETEEEQLVAVLHDILEDTEVTEDYLRDHWIPDQIVDAVVCLTRRKNETYKNYIARCATNRLALAVKKADLEDHLEDTRAISDTLRNRYNDALVYLLEVL